MSVFDQLPTKHTYDFICIVRVCVCVCTVNSVSLLLGFQHTASHAAYGHMTPINSKIPLTQGPVIWIT